MGGDERAAVEAVLRAAGDNPAALAAVETLLVACGRLDAAALVYAHRRAASRHGYDGTDRPVRG